MYCTTSFIFEKACLSLLYIKECLVRYWNGKCCGQLYTTISTWNSHLHTFNVDIFPFYYKFSKSWTIYNSALYVPNPWHIIDYQYMLDAQRLMHEWIHKYNIQPLENEKVFSSTKQSLHMNDTRNQSETWNVFSCSWMKWVPLVLWQSGKKFCTSFTFFLFYWFYDGYNGTIK